MPRAVTISMTCYLLKFLLVLCRFASQLDRVYHYVGAQATATEKKRISVLANKPTCLFTPSAQKSKAVNIACNRIRPLEFWILNLKSRLYLLSMHTRQCTHNHHQRQQLSQTVQSPPGSAQLVPSAREGVLYAVQQCVRMERGDEVWGQVSRTAPRPSIKLSGLSLGARYSFRVIAENAKGVRALSF